MATKGQDSTEDDEEQAVIKQLKALKAGLLTFKL